MIRHIFKMVWNRKRINFLITVEIFFSFLVLFAVMLFAVHYINNYRHTLGFDYEDVYNVSIERGDNRGRVFAGGEDSTALSNEMTRQMVGELRQFDEVEEVAGIQMSPFSQSSGNSDYNIGGRSIRYEFDEATDTFADVMKLNVARGRWFGKEDDGSNYESVVINERLSRDLFGDEDPTGQIIKADADPRGNPIEKQDRVIGVISDFRKDGEFGALENFVFRRKNLNDPKSRPVENLLIRVRPGTSAAFEEKLMARMQTVARDWSFEIEPLAVMRDTMHQIYLAPIIAAGLVAGFLMIMVGLGLTGVLWQNVTQRTKEIGLRRAKGATAGKIYTQILGELLIITSFGLVVGTLIVVQFPLLDLIGYISSGVYISSLLISLFLIYLLTLVCGLYPSWLATKVRPAEALHYE